MAEVDFDEFEDAVYAPVRDGARSAQMNSLLNIAGAVSSIALVVLIGMWGYNLAMRDANGVPVMKALAGPMRIAPADPGGREASNQGLSVNAVAANGAAAPVGNVLKLAPPAIGLTAQDKAGMGETPVKSAAAAANTSSTSSSASSSASDGAGAKPKAPAKASHKAVPAAAAPAAKPAPAFNPATTFTSAALQGATISSHGQVTAASPAVGAAPAQSLVPQARPSGLLQPAAAAVSAPAQLDPSTIAVGTQLVQLGAFETVGEAQAQWVSLSAGFSDVMRGKSMVIQPAEAGGKRFYRLRAAGFQSQAAARRFCALLNADNSDCIPVAQR